jgi:DnaJ-class molecular chaperone
MSQLLLRPPGANTESGEDTGSRPEDDAGRWLAAAGFADQQPDGFASRDARLTLEERISSVWEGLSSTGTADCPVCRGTLERAGHRGVCTSCGSSLA